MTANTAASKTNTDVLDPEMTFPTPAAVTADAGMATLSRAIESYVSMTASDYTDSVALKVINMIFESLPVVFAEPENEMARDHVLSANCMAGTAFTNAFLGISNSLALQMSGRFGVPYGRASAILLPHVIRYNSRLSTKQTCDSTCSSLVSDRKYQQIAQALDLPACTPELGADCLAMAVERLSQRLDMPSSFEDYGVNHDMFLAELDAISQNALDDPCTESNPRRPVASDLKEVLIRAFYN
ncbi:MAG: iron-containing alcohol dehydrogenase [Capsulimonadaceae bacterium]